MHPCTGEKSSERKRNFSSHPAGKLQIGCQTLGLGGLVLGNSGVMADSYFSKISLVILAPFPVTALVLGSLSGFDLGHRVLGSDFSPKAISRQTQDCDLITTPAPGWQTFLAHRQQKAENRCSRRKDKCLEWTSCLWSPSMQYCLLCVGL